jgi:hypothetical protein
MLTKNTDLLKSEIARHIAADAVVQGNYWRAAYAAAARAADAANAADRAAYAAAYAAARQRQKDTILKLIREAS